MYCFCTAEPPIGAISAVSENSVERTPFFNRSCFSKYLWQNHCGFAQGAGGGGTVRVLPEEPNYL